MSYIPSKHREKIDILRAYILYARHIIYENLPRVLSETQNTSKTDNIEEEEVFLISEPIDSFYTQPDEDVLFLQDQTADFFFFPYGSVRMR